MSRSVIEHRRSLADRLLFGVALAACLGTLGIHLRTLVYRTALHHDVAFNLTAGQMTWRGAVPFVNLIDVNPPMIFYISALPAALADASGLSLPAAGLLFFFAIVLLTGWAFTAALELNLRLTWMQRLVVWTFWLWLSLQVFQRDAFGQREHMIFLFLTPFVCLRCARYSGISISRWFAALLGVCAFLALAMKPQFAIPLALVEGVFYLGRKRTLRPLVAIEIVIIALLSLLYLFHFYFIPGMSAFYTEWLPFTVKGYSSFSIGRRTLLYYLILTPYFLVFLGAALLAVAMPFICRRRFWLIVAALGWFSLGSLLVYVQQSKGWPYHRLPFLCAAQFAVFLSLFYVIRTQVKRSQRNLTLALGSLALLATCSPEILPLISSVQENRPFQLPKTMMADLLTSLAEPSDSVLILGTSVRPTFPALTYANRPYANRFLTAYPIAFIFQTSTRKSGYAVPEKWRSEEPVIYQMLTEDVEHFRPRVVLVRSVPNGQGIWNGFTYADYLQRKGFFDTTLRDYRRVGISDEFDVYYLPPTQSDGQPAPLPIDTLRQLEKRGTLELDESLSGSQP